MKWVWLGSGWIWRYRLCCLGEIQKIRENLGPRLMMTHVRETEKAPYLFLFFSSFFFFLLFSYRFILSCRFSLPTRLSCFSRITRLSSFIYVMIYTASFLSSALISCFFFFFFAFFSNCWAVFGNYGCSCVR